MGKFLKIFWSTAVSFAALVGAYFGAVPLRIVWLFWVVVACSVVVAVFAVLVPRGIEIVTRVRGYPKLLKRAAILIDENDKLKEQIRSLQAKASKRWKDGIEEGKWQILGSITAVAYGALALKGVAMREGQLSLVAEANGSGPVIGARYSLESELNGDIMGVVEARQVDGSRKLINLVCIEPTVMAFWQRLGENALLDSSPPAGFRLIPHRITATDPATGAEPMSGVLEGA
jgi:hypothetical protein